MMPTRFALGLTALLLAVACPPGPDDRDSGPAGDAGAGDGSSAPDRPAASDRSSDGIDAGAIDAARAASCARDFWIAVVSGRIVDESGSGLADAMAQLCVRTSGAASQLVCVRPVATAADGRFAIVVPPSARCMTRATMRALRPATTSAASYCTLDLSGQEGELVVANPIAIVATRPATSLPALGDTAQARSVLFDDGLAVEVVPERYFGDDYAALAGRRVDPNAVELCFVADPTAYAGLYAFSPEGDVQGTGLALRIPNTTAIAAGAAVDLFALGGLSCTLEDGSLVREGQWTRFGGGVVSADGAYVEASGASGLPCFNWLAYAPAP